MKRKPVASSNLSSVGYSKAKRVLEVQFKAPRPNMPAPVYRYKDVPPTIAKGLDQAESKGKYLAQNIMGKFDYERIEP